MIASFKLHINYGKNIFVLPFGNQHKKRQNFLLGKFLRINILSPTRITSKLARANLECQIRQRLGKKSAHNRQLMSSCSSGEALEDNARTSETTTDRRNKGIRAQRREHKKPRAYAFDSRTESDDFAFVAGTLALRNIINRKRGTRARTKNRTRTG